MKDRNKKNIIIGILCCLLVFMGVGFAFLNSTLNISGTATAINTWSVLIDSITPIENDTKAESLSAQVKPVKTEASFSVEFTKPGDYLEYEIVIKNEGTIDGYVDSIKANVKNSTYSDLFDISFDESVLNQFINAGKSVSFLMKVEFMQSAKEIPTEKVDFELIIDVLQSTSDDAIDTFLLEAPTLTEGSGTLGKVQTKDVGIYIEGVYSDQEKVKEIAGYQVYEKIGDNYVLLFQELTTAPLRYVTISAEPGEYKVFVARVFAYNESNEMIYSDYSNEIYIDNTKPSTPVLNNDTLTACGGGPDCGEFVPELVDGKYFYDLAIDFSYYYVSPEIYSIDGYEVYEKNGDEYILVEEKNVAAPVIVAILPGEKKTYVARAFVHNSNSEKIYSDYSNEVLIDHLN